MKKTLFTFTLALALTSNAQIITTIAGNRMAYYGGDGGLAISAELNFPNAVAFDAAGNLYIADTHNMRVRKVTNVASGIQQITNSNEVGICPNPASTSLTLTLSKGEGTYTLQITDMLGNTVYHSTLNTQHNTIDVADLAEGVYTISIISNEGMVNKRLAIVR